jgi:hypothetical protein
MTIFHLRGVPHQLADDLQQVRVAKYGELIRALEATQQTHFRHVITLSQAMRADFTSNTSTFHNGRALAMKYFVQFSKVMEQFSSRISCCMFLTYLIVLT